MRQEIYTREDGTRGVRHFCEGESATRSEFAKECDINNIIKKYNKTGLLTHVTSKMPFYADVSEVGDLQSAIEVVNGAQRAFMELPSHIREKFQNDPSVLISWLQDSQNDDEAVKLGLKVAKEKPKDSSESAGAAPKE